MNWKKKTVFGLLGQALLPHASCENIFLKALNAVFQHRQHKSLFSIAEGFLLRRMKDVGICGLGCNPPVGYEAKVVGVCVSSLKQDSSPVWRFRAGELLGKIAADGERASDEERPDY